MVIMGNRIPYGRSVSGSTEAGPVLPEQPPNTFEHTTKFSSVSTGRPGPTISSHQPPRLYASETPPEQCESPVSACTTDRKSTRLNSSHANISYAVFCLKKNNTSHE